MLPSVATASSGGELTKTDVALLVSIDSICDLTGRVAGGAIGDLAPIRVRFASEEAPKLLSLCARGVLSGRDFRFGDDACMFGRVRVR